MGVARSIDQQIYGLLGQLNPKQKQAVLTVVKTFAEEEGTDIWKDKEFVAEMDKRLNDLKSGKVKSVSLAQVTARLKSKPKKAIK